MAMNHICSTFLWTSLRQFFYKPYFVDNSLPYRTYRNLFSWSVDWILINVFSSFNVQNKFPKYKMKHLFFQLLNWKCTESFFHNMCYKFFIETLLSFPLLHRLILFRLYDYSSVIMSIEIPFFINWYYLHNISSEWSGNEETIVKIQSALNLNWGEGKNITAKSV